MNEDGLDGTGLTQLREKIAALEFVKCGMQHEQVKLIDGLPVPLEHEPAGRAYRRNSLCSAEKRKHRPGCGHTTARILMARALEETGRFSPEHREQAAESRQRLARLDSRICRLDHERGHAELKQAALLEDMHRARGRTAAENGDLLRELKAIRAQIDGLSEEHRRYLHALRGLRDEMLYVLDQVMRPQDVP